MLKVAVGTENNHKNNHNRFQSIRENMYQCTALSCNTKAIRFLHTFYHAQSTSVVDFSIDSLLIIYLTVFSKDGNMCLALSERKAVNK